MPILNLPTPPLPVAAADPLTARVEACEAWIRYLDKRTAKLEADMKEKKEPASAGGLGDYSTLINLLAGGGGISAATLSGFLALALRRLHLKVDNLPAGSVGAPTVPGSMPKPS